MAATDAPEPRRLGVDLRTIGGEDRTSLAFNGAVFDMHTRGARLYAVAFVCNAAIGDVYLAAILCADRIALEFEIAAVDSKKARALTNHRFVAALERQSTANRIVRHKAAAARAGRAAGPRGPNALGGHQCDDTGTCRPR